mgnify:CR=1 FL=1
MISGGAEGAGKVSDSENALKLARECIAELQPENIVSESKFLRLDSLHELIKALIIESRSPETHESMGTHFSEDSAVFYLEILFRVIVQVWFCMQKYFFSKFFSFLENFSFFFENFPLISIISF